MQGAAGPNWDDTDAQFQALQTFKKALSRDLPFNTVMAEVEKALLVSAHQRHKRWDIVSRRLGIPRTTLYNRRKTYGLD
jgi:transcriptional regulator of acetoin/glycerol metabolism